MAEKYLGESIKNLGFGLMRLPMKGDEIDMEQTKRMVDAFMAKGFTYFDTAYVYIGGKSEVALKEAVVDRYPRDSFQCATKLPLWDLKDPGEMEKIFQESLDRAGLEYYDFYLLHALSAHRFLLPRHRRGVGAHPAEPSGDGVCTAADQLCGLGERECPVPQVL